MRKPKPEELAIRLLADCRFDVLYFNDADITSVGQLDLQEYGIKTHLDWSRFNDPRNYMDYRIKGGNQDVTNGR